MGSAAGVQTVLRTEEGRLRLLWRLLSFMGLALFAMTVVGLLLPSALLSGSVAMLAGALLGGWILLAYEGRGAGALGFYSDRRAVGETLKGLGLGVAVGGATVAAIAVLGGIRWTPEAGSVGGWLWEGLGALLFFSIPAAAEEAVLRGYPLQALAEVWGPMWALGVTSVAFGALHLSNPNVTTLGVVNVGVAGLFLGVVYLKTASLWWATGAHVGWNWAHGYLTDVSVSGLDLMNAPLYEGIAQGPQWLGGGAFGPEGSAVATVTLSVATVVCWWSASLAPSEAAVESEPLFLTTRSHAGPADEA